MSETAVEFSADFGGGDAKDVGFPHFKALKKAAAGMQLRTLPVPNLSFVLRVDGDITTFGPSGALVVSVTKRRVSVDLVLTIGDRGRIETVLVDSLMSVPRLLNDGKFKSLANVVFVCFAAECAALASRYRDAVGASS
jgi:hypothetical protein